MLQNESISGKIREATGEKLSIFYKVSRWQFNEAMLPVSLVFHQHHQA
jgi:hypothetical protein